MHTKTQILDLLRAFAEQRPGLEPRDYISSPRDHEGRRAYFAQAREITRDLHDARELLRAVEMRGSITAADVLAAIGTAGRLTITERKGRLEADYCAGQYFPAEYRGAVCRALKSTLWAFWREGAEAAQVDDKRARIMEAAKANLSTGAFRRWFKEA